MTAPVIAPAFALLRIALIVIEPSIALGTEDDWVPPEIRISDRTPVNAPTILATAVLKFLPI